MSDKEGNQAVPCCVYLKNLPVCVPIRTIHLGFFLMQHTKETMERKCVQLV